MAAEALRRLNIGSGPAANPLPAPALEVTAEVRRELKLMMRGNGAFVRVALERGEPHAELVRSIFADEGVPADLINLAVVESGFRTNAVSPRGAMGLWQFTKQTARRYGLRVDRRTDQRTQVVRSTIAAARLLKDLFALYDDWYFALAAYNAGTAAIQHTHGDDFWRLCRSRRISGETRRFVPRFIAATIMAKIIEHYGPGDIQKNLEFHLARAQRNERFAFVIESAKSVS